ncbi:MAG TPA: hypothetical protein PKA58_35490, partial [Polyangium sp.]|nr:hypothetical protein [Polyangium sp.]
MSLPEFLVLRTLSGITALQGDDGATVTPSMTRRFVKLVHNIRTTSISVNELHYLARHLVAPGTSVGFTDDTIAALVSALETIVNNIHDDILASEAAGAPPLQTKEINARYDQAVLQHIAGAWNVDAVVLEHLLTTVLKSFVFGTKGAIVDFRYATSMVSEAVRIDALKRLAKLVLPTQRLSLSIVEWRLIYPGNGQTDWPNLNDIPVQPLSDATAYRIQFQWLHRLMDLATLRDLLPEKAETLRLIAEAIGRFVANEITESALLDAIATVTGWPREDIEFLMTHGFGYSGLPPAQCDCLEERAFLCLSRALDMLKRFGAKASQASYWSNIDAPCPPPPPQLDVQNIDVAAIALDIKRVVRAKYSLEQWPGVARPIRDVLREKQRDALVHYLLFQLDVEGTNDLYNKLLIDVEMSACQLTSRIKMALGSVQTYVQRVFLGLEAPNATLDEDAASEWSWMKNYRVWEANRKIFLYPENWIEPELRDDKTPFFRTLENRILQGEITAEAVEGAYVEYLESLHEVARLEVAAICREFDEQNSSDRVDIVHV